ncbi:MAG: hypothetical protein HUU38_26845, partial [Anaerolineales bacterium]|nr:hypothetical protein [Anaerolineales bacterium]
NHALRYLLKHAGDAVRIKVAPEGQGWRVIVFGSDQTLVLGSLFYDAFGQLVLEKSSTPDEMRRVALNVCNG